MPEIGPQPPQITLRSDWDKQEMTSEPSSTRPGCNLIQLLQRKCQAFDDKPTRKCQELISKYHDCGRWVGMSAEHLAIVFIWHLTLMILSAVHTCVNICGALDNPYCAS